VTLDAIRKRSVMERAAAAPYTGTIVDMCDDVDALFAVVDALPRCVSCSTVATALTVAGTFRCDAHKHAYAHEDMPYATPLRVLARKP